MIKSEPVRDIVLYVRIQEVNKKFIEEKSRLANLDEASFVDRLITGLRTTEDGQKFVALDVEIDGSKKRRVR